MKKKFLSLMMAAAVVATTSVSAFADTKDYEVSKVKEADAKVTIIGDIANQGGHFVPSTISVTVPTAANFSVDGSGNTVSPEIQITSRGEEPVSVIANGFYDTTGEDSINVVSESELESDTNGTKVALKLIGDTKSVVLKSTGGTNGLFKPNGSTPAGEEDTMLGTVTKSNPVNLTLEVKVKSTGRTAPTNPLQDKFTLKLKLKKANTEI